MRLLGLRVTVEATGRPAPFMSPCGGLLAPAFLLYFTAPVTRRPRQPSWLLRKQFMSGAEGLCGKRCGASWCGVNGFVLA